MPFSLTEFVTKRPFLFHLTSKENLRGLQQTGHLRSTATLAEAAGRADILRDRRGEPTTINVAGIETVICDQAKLSFKNVKFEEGLTKEGLLQLLNRRVFFWPGTEDGPIDYGRRHFARYRASSPALLRVPTTALLNANPDIEPMFCKYNSGSPRCSYGNPSPRGPSSFLSAIDFTGSVGDVVEFTVEGSVRLPNETERAESYEGPWNRLYAGSMAPRHWSEYEL